MGLITRDAGLSRTKSLYGENSDQYFLHQKLEKAEEVLMETGGIYLGKMCSQEYIIVRFKANSSYVTEKIRYFFDKDIKVLRNTKVSKIDNRSIHSIVYDDIYKLISGNAYTIIDAPVSLIQ